MSLTPDEAVMKFCPMVNGKCLAGGCHFWLWDEVTNEHTIKWPEDIHRPPPVTRFGYERGDRDPRSAGEEYRDNVQKALHPVIGRQMFDGEVVSVYPHDMSLRDIKVKVEIRKTGDCCMRRAGERAKS